jgi:hypothetical protein
LELCVHPDCRIYRCKNCKRSYAQKVSKFGEAYFERAAQSKTPEGHDV